MEYRGAVEHVGDYGEAYTKGSSFRARAERRQREYRADVLGLGYRTHGHWLAPLDAENGANFVVDSAIEAVRSRAHAGKGVKPDTFFNMLTSQAMCFNIFAPLAKDVALARSVLAGFVPGLTAVRRIAFEYTPAREVFNDQTGKTGVDSDLLIEADWESGPGVLVVETKFVEPDFSTCGFRRPEREPKGKPMCPQDVAVANNPQECLYESAKRYRYWTRSIEHGTLREGALTGGGCPFGGSLWQLWVNHTLAHVEARRGGFPTARYAVCAPAGNHELLRGGQVLASFTALVTDPASVLFIDVDLLIDRIVEIASGDPGLRPWAEGVQARYHRI